MNPKRVLVVDDSPLMRKLIGDVLSSDPELEVVGAAPDPVRAWEMIQRTRPDVLTLDVEMPKMNGIEFLEKLMRAHPMPVVMVSSLTEPSCALSLRALALGAIDVVAKPKLDLERTFAEIGAELVAKVKGAAQARVKRPPSVGKMPRTTPSRAAFPARRARSSRSASGAVLAIGASTGGTTALRALLAELPDDAPGIVIVQHMPEHFTQRFAEHLDKLCAIRVREAAEGDLIEPGQALIAPGGSAHLRIERSGTQAVVRLVEGAPVSFNRPSVDVLFHSCAEAIGSQTVAALLTGMGHDGAEGLLALRRAGARTVAQDEATSVVFGMPGEAVARGAAEFVTPLDDIAPLLMRLAEEVGSRSAPARTPA
jgi:two-component system, chemotaxis family, protein-glutamate methylesterase/glutaminase